MQVTKTKNRTGIVNNLVYAIIMIGAVLIFTAPFWHVDLPKEREGITILKDKFDSREESLANDILALRKDYDKGAISAKEYLLLNDLRNSELTELKERNSAIVKQTIDDQRILSWKSPRAFILGLGIRLPYVLFSLIISLLVLARKNDPKQLKYALSFLQIACWSISAYLMIWVFWDFQDYSLKTYRYAFITISLLMGTACTFFLANYKTSISILKSKIRYLMNLMADKAIEKGHIRDEKSYDDEIIYPALKKLDE